MRHPLGVTLPTENDPRPPGSIVELDENDLHVQMLIRSGAVVDLKYLDPSEHVDTAPVAENPEAPVARKRRRYGNPDIVASDVAVAATATAEETEQITDTSYGDSDGSSE